MANNFTRFPITGGDDGVWGPLLLANIRDMVGLNSCKLYDDSGTLKVSQGKIGINDNTNEGIMTIDTITTISIAGVSNSNWAQIEVELSGGVPVFSATNISGATDVDTLPVILSSAFVGAKNGYYINATKRAIGAIYKDSTGTLAVIINNLHGEQLNGGKFYQINNLPQRGQVLRVSYKALNGGTAVGSGTWFNIALNTVDYNFIDGASLASPGTITLPRGAYIVRGYAMAFRVGAAKFRLEWRIGGVIEINSSQIYMGSLSTDQSQTAILDGYLLVEGAASREYVMTAQTDFLLNTIGLGKNGISSTSDSEYRALSFEKIG